MDLIMFSICSERSPINLSSMYREHITRTEREKELDIERERSSLPFVVHHLPFVVCRRRQGDLHFGKLFVVLCFFFFVCFKLKYMYVLNVY